MANKRMSILTIVSVFILCYGKNLKLNTVSNINIVRFNKNQNPITKLKNIYYLIFHKDILSQKYQKQ